VYSFGQKGSLKGNIADTTSKQTLHNAVVSLLYAKDSVLYKFTRSDSKGDFSFSNVDTGNYLLLVTYPTYADYVDKQNMKDSSVMEVGSIPLIQKAAILKEVIVKQTIAAIKLKGDTTEYNADSFKVAPNSTVEDLLKKLPGIQVDKDGKITAQGETVQKVLVDGEEFFGDDPTLVTKNLRADMVDKVQVYDKKSDQAAFTGVDDGQKTKTLNIKLKDDKKKGFFGKVELGGGTDGYHDSQAMINAFKKKQKFAAYGIVSNTGKTGLNWQERDSYGESFANNIDYDESTGFYTGNFNNDELDSWSGRFEGQGYPLVQTGGLHYNNKYDDDKQNVNANYKIMQLHVDGNSATNSQYILPDTTYFSNQKQKFNNQILRNRLNGSYEYMFDSSSSLKFTADGSLDHKITNNQYYTESLASDSSLVNKSLRNVSDVGDKRLLNTTLLWKKKLHKKGRTLSFNLIENFNDNNSSGYLDADNEYYVGGVPSSSQLINQYKQYNGKNIMFDSKLTYTEPLSKVSLLSFNYGVVINNSNSNRNSFNRDSAGKYNDIDSLYSNDYQFNTFTQRGGIAYNLSKKKFKMNVGNNIGFSNFDQINKWNDSTLKRNFVNWYPTATFSYSFTSQRRINLQYNGRTVQPTIQQIQPILNNEDPLNISVGNPNLKPAFRNSIWLSFNDYKVLSDRGIWASISYNSTINAITSKDYIDSIGRKIYQSVNINNGNSNLNGYLNYNKKLKKLDMYAGINANFGLTKYSNIVNGVLNITKSNNYTFGFNMGKYKEKKFDVNVNVSATYTSSISSIQSSIQTNYWSANIAPNVDVYLPLKFQVHTDLDYNYRQKTDVFSNNTNVAYWNAWIGKKFMKKDALMLKISANDILNQNIGFNRSVNSNYITQNTYSTIQRYFMFSVIWNFTKTAAGSPAPSNP
jgi:hypothetical protein